MRGEGPAQPSSTTMNTPRYVLGALLLAFACCCCGGVNGGCPNGSDNCTTSTTCDNNNGTCGQVDRPCTDNATCLEPVTCSPGNSSCIPPVEPTSRLLEGVDVAGNSSTKDKPLSTTTHFSPSPFLGVIPDRPGSVVVGEVFHDIVGPRHSPFSFPRGRVQQFLPQGPPSYRPATVEIQIGQEEYPGRHPTGYGGGKTEVEIRPAGGYGGDTEIDIRPHQGYGKPEIEVKPQLTGGKPLGSYGKPPVFDPKSGGLLADHGLGKPSGVSFRPGKNAQHREFGKPYDPAGVPDFGGYQEHKPRPFYDAFENMKNLIKPSKDSGPYIFEDKPIQEDTGEEPYKLAFPPHGPGDGAPHHEPHHVGGGGGSSKWKSVLRFLTTVLPIGLLFAALTPNVLVVSPSEEPPALKGPGGTKRSVESPLGPCGLQKLCEALSTSPADFEQFLKAAKEGSTPELREIIKKAEEKSCSTIECSQPLELKPTQPTFR